MRRLLFVVVVVLLSGISGASGRDDGRFGPIDPGMKKWFEGLASEKGPCCSDADGSVVADPDWETKGGHYRVRIEGTWYDVPDDAVLTQPNRYGKTMVWPLRGISGVTIRCFIPGPMT